MIWMLKTLILLVRLLGNGTEILGASWLVYWCVFEHVWSLNMRLGHFLIQSNLLVRSLVAYCGMGI